MGAATNVRLGSDGFAASVDVEISLLALRSSLVESSRG